MYVWLRGQMMKRLHILIEDEVYAKLKAAAAVRRESLADIIRGSLRAYIEKDLEAAGLPSMTKAELQELLRLMDEEESIKVRASGGKPRL